MELYEAKKYLNSKGYILEDTASNTKALVGKFWKAKKEGASFTKEDAEALLNAPDFNDAVNQKYQNYIKSVCKKIISGEPVKQDKKSEGEVKPFETVDYSKNRYKVFGGELLSRFRYAFYKEVRIDANNVVEKYNKANEALEFLNQFNLEDSEKMRSAMACFQMEKDPTIIYAKSLLDTCEGSFKSPEDENTFKTNLKKYSIDPERIDNYYKELAGKIEEIGFSPLKFGHETTYNGKIPTQIYFTCDYKGFNIYFQLHHGYPCFYVDSFKGGKSTYNAEKDAHFYDNTECDLVWHNPRGSLDTRNSVKVPKLTFKNLKLVKDYLDKYGEEIVKAAIKKTDDFNKWYNSLSDIGRDIYNYYQDHPNGNWSGD